MITQHQGNLTIKEIEKISSQGEVLSNLYYSDRFPNFRGFWSVKAGDSTLGQQLEMNFRIHGCDIAQKFGKPNCHMKGYESYPGAWVFYDDVRNLRWLVFSDGIRKNHFKGTSYEVTIPEHLTEEEFIAATREFFQHFGLGIVDR